MILLLKKIDCVIISIIEVRVTTELVILQFLNHLFDLFVFWGMNSSYVQEDIALPMM